MDEFIDHQQMIQKRQDIHMAISKKKGRVSVDQFEEGDRVIIQSPQSGKWLEIRLEWRIYSVTEEVLKWSAHAAPLAP